MLICAALWSIAGIFIKLIPWPGIIIAAFRSLIAGATIGVYMLMKRYKLIVNKQTIIAGIFEGGVFICFVCANKLTTAANAIVLQYTSPVFIVLFSALIFRQKIKKQDLWVVILTVIGITLFFFDSIEAGSVSGNLVAILAGVLMALMFVFMGELEGEKRFSALLIGQLFVFVVGTPFILTKDIPLSAVPILSVFILGVFQLGISYVLYGRASGFCPPLACCLLGALEPLLNPIWVLIFDGEKPGLYALCGGIVVIASITAWCIASNREKANA